MKYDAFISYSHALDGKLGRGGMRSKLRAAKVASEAGVNVAIVNGRDPQAIAKALARKIGTYFPPHQEKS